MGIYGPSFKKARADRLDFCEGRCETCKHDGTKYRLECHHPQPSEDQGEFYRKDKEGLLTLKDVVILCEVCHDLHTTYDREFRFKKNSSFDIEPTPENVLTKDFRDENCNNQTDWNLSPVDVQQPNGKPNRQVRESRQKDFGEPQED